MKNRQPAAFNAEPADDLIVFGPYELDLKARRLSRGRDPVRLGARAMDLLLAMVERPGSLISSQELTDRAWPRSVVVESNLRAQIAALREALEDGNEGLRYIQNVPGRGYRFICPMDRPASPVLVRQATPRVGGYPVAPQRVLGREDLTSAVLESLPRRRLITITGAGGIGKTAFAATLADGFAPTCADGVVWVEFSTLTEEDSAAEAIALSAGLINVGPAAEQSLLAWLRDKQMLLVLDCCDRVVANMSKLAERILAECAHVHLMVTSREVLRAVGEIVVRLPPLNTPSDVESLTAEHAMTYPAVQLFVECASSVLGGFALRDDDARRVANICLRLDGNPLAIELVAGHLIALELSDLATLLEDQFRMLAIGRRTAVARHRTLQAVIQWSFETLSPNERQTLLGLAIFEDETSFPAIRAVITAPAMPVEDLMQALSRLVDKSLVAVKASPSGPTYRLTHTTRAFAVERLKDEGALGRLTERHARFAFATL